jgi:hypothetical protein
MRTQKSAGFPRRFRTCFDDRPEPAIDQNMWRMPTAKADGSAPAPPAAII